MKILTYSLLVLTISCVVLSANLNKEKNEKKQVIVAGNLPGIRTHALVSSDPYVLQHAAVHILI
jgi:hypothetical protein